MTRLGQMLLGGLIAWPVWSADVYLRGDWASLQQASQQQDLIVHFWAQDCAPCLHELSAWGRYHREHPGQALVLIQMGEADDSAAQHLLKDAHLEDVRSLQRQSPDDEYLHYEVDPDWQGELPFTLVLHAGRVRTRLRGEVDFRVLPQN